MIQSLAKANEYQPSHSIDFEQAPDDSGTVDMNLKTSCGLRVLDYEKKVRRISKVSKKRETYTKYTENQY